MATPNMATPNPDRFLNRELSWLAFNERVLEEASNEQHPLLERLRFLAISHSNLEEFFTVRVAGLKAQLQSSANVTALDGQTPLEQLAAIYERTNTIMAQQQASWLTLVDALAEAGIHLTTPEALPREEKQSLKRYFRKDLLPMLTPLAVDPAHPFPFLPNEALTLALQLVAENGQEVFALLPLPRTLPRFIPTAAGYLLLEDVLIEFLPYLFPGASIKGHGMFEVLRDSELEIDDEAEDLMRVFEIALKRRRRGHVIQLWAGSSMPKTLLNMVVQALSLAPQDVFQLEGLVALSDAAELIDAPKNGWQGDPYAHIRPTLQFPSHQARFPERIRDYDGDCFAAIKAKDMLVHHPYESFNVVVRFLEQAADDPEVHVIKQTLYRTSHDSPIIKALIKAAEAGKQVTAVVEIKARFDEAANIQWARDMERAGVHVVFGFLNLKTHAKVSLVVRREQGKLISYVHFGTGNYHPHTAKVYTDLSYFTVDPILADDAIKLFNYLTGYAKPRRLKALTIAPDGLRERLLELIHLEIANANAGKPAAIWLKCNALLDARLINALYEASEAGVQIDLVVRGICVLRPGVPRLSENIRVKSIVGRFLEHSRICCFANGNPMPSAKAKVFLSSADWMPRNCDWRVETLVPVRNATVHRQVIEQIMVAYLKDNQQSWQLYADGSYQRIRLQEGDKPFSAHQYFLTNPSLSGRGSDLARNGPLPALQL